jgi:hypothetical protein
MNFDFRGWARQPSTILGFGTVGGLIAAAAASYAGGTVSGIVAAGGLAFALVHMAMPDNTQAAADAQALAIDMIKGVASHTMEVQLPQIMRDGLRFITDMAPKPPVPILGTDGKPIADPTINTGTLAKAAVIVACLLGGTFALSACSVQQLQLACQTDAATVPIADATLATLVPAASAGIAIDTALVHPAVVKYCASLGAVPVAAPTGGTSSLVTPSTTPLVPAPAPAAAPAAPAATN